MSTAGHAVCRPRMTAGAGPRPGDCGNCFTDHPSGGQDGTELGAGPALGPSCWGNPPPTCPPAAAWSSRPSLGSGKSTPHHLLFRASALVTSPKHIFLSLTFFMPETGITSSVFAVVLVTVCIAFPRTESINDNLRVKTLTYASLNLPSPQ